MLLNHKIRLLNRQSMLFTERAKEGRNPTDIGRKVENFVSKGISQNEVESIL